MYKLNDKLNDKIKGLFYALTIGDILGIPFEFKNFKFSDNSENVYTGVISDKDGYVQFQYVKMDILMYRPSDDTRMTIALLKSLVETNFIYDRNNVISHYLEWANKEKMMGKNTRALLKGVTTVRGYTARFAKLTSIYKADMQSNGSLMRASPLAFLKGPETVENQIKKDTNITNPNEVNCEATIIFVSMLRMIINDNCTKEKLKEYLINRLKTNELKYVKEAIDGSFVNFPTGQKGYVLNALHTALYAFFKYDSFEDAMQFIINIPYSDTDTNASICGALFGAYIGFNGLMKEEKTKINVSKISNIPEIKEIDELIKAI